MLPPPFLNTSWNKTPDLHNRNSVSIHNIITLLEFFLKNTYFPFQGVHFEQVHGVAMASTISPIVTNLFMEDIEIKAISTATNPPKDMAQICYMTLLSSEIQNTAINSYNTSAPLTHTIQFTVETPNIDESMPFSDTPVSPGPDNTLLTTVDRIPTHTDQ